MTAGGGGTNLGGFGFGVGFDISDALANMAALRNAASETATAVTASLSINLAAGLNVPAVTQGLNTIAQAAAATTTAISTVGTANATVQTAAAVANLNAATAAAKELKESTGTFAVTVVTGPSQANVDTLAGKLRDLQDEAKTSLVLTVNRATLEADLKNVSQAIDELGQGEKATINLRLNDADILAQAARLKPAIDDALGRGANVQINAQSGQAAADDTRAAVAAAAQEAAAKKAAIAQETADERAYSQAVAQARAIEAQEFAAAQAAEVSAKRAAAAQLIADERAYTQAVNQARTIEAQEFAATQAAEVAAKRAATAELIADERAYSQAVNQARAIELEEERRANAASVAATRAANAQKAADAKADRDKADAERATQRGETPAGGALRYSVSIDTKNAKEETDQVLKYLRGVSDAAQNISLNIKGDQTEAQINQIKETLQTLKSGDAITLNVTADPSSAARTLSAFEASAKAAADRGVTVIVRADTTQARREVEAYFHAIQRGALLGSGLGGGLLFAGAATVGLGLAAVATEKLTAGFIGTVKAGFEFNAQMQASQIALTSFTGSASLAQEALDKLRDNADKTPFGTQEVIASGQTFLNVMNGSIDGMLRMVDAAEALSASRPGKTLEDATRSLREYIGGDYTSLARVFDLPRAKLIAIRDQGGPIEEQIKKILAEAHATQAQVDALGQTWDGVTSTFSSHFKEMAGITSQPLFAALTVEIKTLNDAFEQNKTLWVELATNVGVFIGALGELIVILTKYATSRVVIEGLAGSFALLATQINMAVSAADALGYMLGLVSKKELDAQMQRTGQSANAILNTGPQAAPTARPGTRSASDQALQDAAGAQNKADGEHSAALAAQEKELTRIATALKENKEKSDEITLAYERQIVPLQRQIAAIRTPDFSAQIAAAHRSIEQVSIDRERQSGQAPQALQAEVAGATALVKHQQDILSIQQRRGAIAWELYDAQRAISMDTRQEAERLNEMALRDEQEKIRLAQESRTAALESLRAQQEAQKNLRTVATERLQDEQKQAQQNRQDELTGLQEQMRLRSEARSAEMDALREVQTAAKAAREDELTGLQESIRLRRDAYSENLAQIKEDQQLQADLFSENDHKLDIAHKKQQQAAQDRIDALTRTDRAASKTETGDSPAQKELKALEAAHTLQQQAKSLGDAEDAVREARTGKDRRDALHRLAELRTEQAYEARKAALQLTADNEKKAREDAAATRQEKIQAEQEKLQAADRKYQNEKDARDEKQRVFQHEQSEAARIEADAEHQRERQEDAAVRAEQQANHQADLVAAKVLKDAEIADRKAAQADQETVRQAQAQARNEDRADQLLLRQQQEKDHADDVQAQKELHTQERLDHEETRRENDQIKRDQKTIQDDHDRDAKAAADLQKVRDEDAYQRLLEREKLEDQILKLQLKILEAEDPSKLSDAARRQAILDYLSAAAKSADAWLAAMTDLAALPLEAQLAADQRAMALALAPLKDAKLDLDIAQAHAQVLRDHLKDSTEPTQTIATNMTTAADAAERMARAVPSALSPVAGTGGGDRDPKTGLIKVPGTWPGGAPGAPSPAANQGTASGVEAILAEIKEIAAHRQEILDALEAPFDDFLGHYLPETFWPTLVASADNTAGTWNDAYTAHGDEMLLNLQKPFDDFYGPYFSQTFWPAMKSNADNTVGTWDDAWNAHRLEIVTALEAPFIEFQDQYFQGAFIPKAGEQGSAAATAYIDGWTGYDWSIPMNAWATNLLNWLAGLCPNFHQQGENMAICYFNGWVDYWNTHTLPAPRVDQPASTAPSGKGGTPGGGNRAGPTPGTVRTLPIGTVVPPGQDPFTTFSLPAAGATLPRAAVAATPRAATAGVGGSTTIIGGSSGPISVNIHNEITAGGITDHEAFAQHVTDRTVASIIDVLDQAQKSAPAPIARYLPGGR